MLAKDLLVLFQAVNEGVINILGVHASRCDTHISLALTPLITRTLLRDVACRC